MADESFRVYVTCNRVDRSDRAAVQQLLDEYGLGIADTHEFDREVTYTSETLEDSPENRDTVATLESDIRDAVAEDDVVRDKKNTSPQAPGIDGVSYVTGIIIGVTDD